MKGELPLFQEAQKLQEELMTMMPEEVSDETLEQEKYLTKNAKKIVLLGAGLAAQKYMQDIENEQEILSNLADMVAEVYNMESAVLRTEKAIDRSGEEVNKQKLLIYLFSRTVNCLFRDRKSTRLNSSHVAI